MDSATLRLRPLGIAMARLSPAVPPEWRGNANRWPENEKICAFGAGSPARPESGPKGTKIRPIRGPFGARRQGSTGRIKDKRLDRVGRAARGCRAARRPDADVPALV